MKIYIISILSFFVLMLLIRSGILNFLTTDGSISNVVYYSLFFYWIIFSGIIWIALNIKKKYKELFLSILSLSISVFLIEFFLRFIPGRLIPLSYNDIVAPSKELNHIYLPNKLSFDYIYDRGIFIKTNPDGLRSVLTKEEFLQKDIRIAFMGDSFVFGWGVSDGYTFSKLTEKKLIEKTKKNIAILNCGVVSYSPFLGIRQYKKIVKFYKPQIVFYFLDPGDINDDLKYKKELKKNGDVFFSINKTLKRSIRLYRLLYPIIYKLRLGANYPFEFFKNRFITNNNNNKVLQKNKSILKSNLQKEYRQKQNKKNKDLKIDPFLEKNKFFIYYFPLKDTEMYFNNTLKNINNIYREVKKDKAKFVLVLLPRYIHWNIKECPNNWEKAEAPITGAYSFNFFRYFDKKSKKLPYYYFNPLTLFQKTKIYPMTFSSDPHWNEAGHSFFADILSKYIIKNALIEK